MNPTTLAIRFTTCFLLFAMGCSSGTGDGRSVDDSSPTDHASAAQQYCDADYERLEQCDSSVDWAAYKDDIIDECVQESYCIYQETIREPALAPLLTCLGQRPCDKSEDDCFDEVASSVGQVAGQQDYVAACQDKLSSCPNGSFLAYCTEADTMWKLFSTELYEALRPCYDLACDQVVDCIDDAAEALVGHCES